MKIILILALICIINATTENAFYKININKMGFNKLSKLKNTLPKDTWYIEVAHTLLVHGPQEPLYESLYSVNQVDFSLITSNTNTVSPNNIKILTHQHKKDVAKIKNSIILIDTIAGYSVIYTQDTKSFPPSDKTTKFTKNMILAKQTENMEPLKKFSFGKNVQEMVNKVNAAEWRREIEKIASWNRFSFGSQILDAKKYLTEELKKLPVTISEEEFRLSGRTISNLVADFTPYPNDKDYYIIGAHLDSISNTWGNERVAPGAEDNGSSSAGLLLMARILTAFKSKKNIRFIWFLGEEQGLHGSTANAINLVNRGEKDNMKFMLNMDMIGFSVDPNNVRVLLETNREYDATIQKFRRSAERYCDMGVTISYRPSGSDHVPYLRRGMEAILIIDADWNRYPHYHRVTDLPRYLVDKMAFEILKMNVGYIGNEIY